nr:hypothetical protein [uncultured Cohaesibacter sp.]
MIIRSPEPFVNTLREKLNSRWLQRVRNSIYLFGFCNVIFFGNDLFPDKMPILGIEIGTEHHQIVKYSLNIIILYNLFFLIFELFSVSIMIKRDLMEAEIEYVENISSDEYGFTKNDEYYKFSKPASFFIKFSQRFENFRYYIALIYFILLGIIPTVFGALAILISFC